MEHPENAAESTFRFQVNLGGMLDILSNHLYKSPDVFLRELLQNGICTIAEFYNSSLAFTFRYPEAF